MTALLPLIPILPLGGFVLTGLLGRRYPDDAHRIAVWAVVASWVVASIVAVMALLHASPFGTGGAGITLWTWIPAYVPGGFSAGMGLFVDPLTACLLIVVTTIGMLVHVYSIGYMAHDPGRWRFFAYLNLFMFSMLTWSWPTTSCSSSPAGSWSACAATS